MLIKFVKKKKLVYSCWVIVIYIKFKKKLSIVFKELKFFEVVNIGVVD